VQVKACVAGVRAARQHGARLEALDAQAQAGRPSIDQRS
jgi:hypothetical protein